MKIKKQTERTKIINLLKKNGYKRIEENYYGNDYFAIDLSDEQVSLAYPTGHELFAPRNYYAILGLITYLYLVHDGELKIKI